MSMYDALLEQEDREHFAFSNLTAAEQNRFQLQKYITYKNNPWEFLKDCVWTLNQVDSQNPVAKYPSHFPYVETLCRVWHKHPLLAIPKSRRMLASWTFIPLYLWDTMFRKGRFNGFVSKKEDDAGDLVSRAEFTFRHIPEWRIPRVLLPKIRQGKMTKSPPILEFEELHSKIQGFPMGADQLRQFTLSGLFGDECAFWPDAEEFYTATKPTIDGGGRMTLVSSRSPGFFKKIVFDRIDAPDYNFPEKAPAEVKIPVEGVEIWQNPKNRFVVIDLHYTANPEKRGREWVTAVKNSMPLRQFMREYEKTWATFEGLPVYGDFTRGYHTGQTLEVDPSLPLLLGFDFGLTPACIVTQLNNNRLLCLKEYIGTNEALSTFAPRVFQDLSTTYPEQMRAEGGVLCFIDPAGFQRAQTDARTCAQILRNTGFSKVDPGPVDFESRKSAVEGFLTRHGKDGAAFLVDETKCPILAEGFTGGYQYPENATEVEPQKLRPLKNRFSHIHDALQYVAAGAVRTLRHYNIEIPLPYYGFQKQETQP